MPTLTRTTLFFAIGFVFLWNSGFIGAEFGLPYSGPFTLMLWRYVALSVVLALLVTLRRRRAKTWPGISTIVWTAIIGILSHGVWLGCVLLSLDSGVPSGIVALVVALQPLATGAFSGLATGERTGPMQWFGLALGFVGVAIAVGARMDAPGSGSAYGYLLPLGSVVAITIASLIQRRRELSALVAQLALDTELLVQAVATALVFVVPALVLEGLQTQWTTAYVATMAWLVLAVSFGAYALMWILLSRLDATRVASLFYLGPPVTMAMAWLAFGDTLIATDVIGLTVVASGVYLVTRQRRATASAA